MPRLDIGRVRTLLRPTHRTSALLLSGLFFLNAYLWHTRSILHPEQRDGITAFGSLIVAIGWLINAIRAKPAPDRAL